MKILALMMVALFAVSGCSESDNKKEKNISEFIPESSSEFAPKIASELNSEFTPEYRPGDDIPAIAYLKHNEMYNPEAVIPAQCYTKTEGVNNPCFVCHQTYSDESRPNFMKDGSLQGAYEFSDIGMTNSWKNLFKDRSEAIADISDKEINEWTNTDNYSSFIEKQKQSENWGGEISEIKQLPFPEKAFAEDGFASDGSHWVAYNYKPLPSSFWPTNGSTGDAMIRLPEKFMTVAGQYNKSVYQANLALVEMTIKNQNSLTVAAVDEKIIGADLNNDGQQGIVTVMNKQAHYLGDASDTAVEHMLFPQGTEFLHTVRYVGVDAHGGIYNAPRMKEVRYMRKAAFKSPAALRSSYFIEAKEKHLEQLPRTVSIGDRGIDNGFGWVINGYIENEHGNLRQQNKQELAFCNGCHKTVGSTIDQVFSFARKVEGQQGWGYINLKTIQDVPSFGTHDPEYLTYFKRAGGGDEFRQNQEMLQRWFDEKGNVDAEKVLQAKSIYELITPSAERALVMNKAYKTIVDEQSYIFGRDVVLKPAVNVLQEVDTTTEPLLEEHRYQWDIRLDWSEGAQQRLAAE